MRDIERRVAGDCPCPGCVDALRAALAWANRKAGKLPWEKDVLARAIVAQHGEGLSQTQIAACLGCSHDTVWVVEKAALAKARECIE